MLFLKNIQRCLVRSIPALVVVALLAGTSGAAETESTPNEKPVNEAMVEPAQPDRVTAEYVKGYFTDTGKIVASPITWRGNDWLAAALVVGAASGIYFADADIRNFAQRNQNLIDDRFANIGNSIGNPLFILPPLGLFYLYGHIYDDPKARRATLLAVESLAISSAFAMTLKLATQRPRPHTGESSTTWNGPGPNKFDTSFPSIHTQSAFSVAAVFAEEYDSNPYVAPLAYGLATLTGLSRIYSDKHWASDAFFGAALGYFVGKAVVRYHPLGNYRTLKIVPGISQQGFGLMAEYRF